MCKRIEEASGTRQPGLFDYRAVHDDAAHSPTS